MSYLFVQEAFKYNCSISDSDFEYAHHKFAVQNEGIFSQETQIQFNVSKVSEGWYLTIGPPEVSSERCSLLRCERGRVK